VTATACFSGNNVLFPGCKSGYMVSKITKQNSSDWNRVPLSTALFPAPRSLHLSPSAGPGSEAEISLAIDRDLPAQGFRLSTDATGIRIQYADAAGLRYAQQALDQLRSSTDFETTGVEVEDWPDFAVRGFMLDVSRDRVPTRATLLRLLDLMSLARINHFELYMEHTFAYADHPVVWMDASPLTAADIHWLDDQCVARGIALVPNQNSLGHMERWLAHPEYKDRALNPEGFVMMDQQRPAATVQPTTENAEFVSGLLAELASHFRARRINIGADEPFELIVDQGDGVMPRDNAQVYFDYVKQVITGLTATGYTVEFWADVFGEHPELMGQVPEGAVPLIWQYDSASLTRAVVERATETQKRHWESVGLDVVELQSGFRGRGRVLTDAGEPFWVAPGTGAWQSITGRTENALEVLIDAAEFGIAHSAPGYLTTAWGDHGAYDPPAISFGPMIFGGAVSWNLAANRDLDLVSVLNERVLHDPTGISGRVLVDIGRAAAALDAPLLNASQLFTVLHGAGELRDGPWPAPAGLDAADEILRVALDELDSADPAALDADTILREVRQAIRLARFGVAVLRLGPGGIDTLGSREARALLVRFEGLLEEHRRTWLLRSRVGGLTDSVNRLAPLRRKLTILAAAHTESAR
jgi:hexosaminidase